MQRSTTPAALVAFDKLPDSAVVRLPVVKLMTGYSPASIWRRAADAADRFPKPRKIGPRNTGWNVGELRKFLADSAGVAA